MSSKLRWLGVVGALCLISVPSIGCKKETPKEDTDEKKSDKKKKGGDKGDKKKAADDDDKGMGALKGKGGAYVQHDVLKHIPKNCPMAQIYIDVSALQKNDAFAANVDTFQDKITSAMKDKDTEKAGAFLKSLKKSGIDPTKDIKEVAFCGVAKKDFTVAFGGDFDGKDPLAALVKAGKDSTDTDDDMEKKTKDGVDYLQGKKAFIAQVAPNVLVIADDLDSALALKKEDDQSASWDVASGRIISFDFNEKETKVNVDLTSKDDNLELKVVADTKEKIPAEGDLKKVAAQAGTNLAKGPFSAIADDVKATKITVDGGKVTVVFTMSNAHATALFKSLATSDPKDMQMALKNAIH